ncbi:MAG: hypothetical protein KKG69_18155 [Alphaproteobacteria bacterium]|uniref:Uncharacterized protein n=1 Tax=viral metagenome TaxID=1070528 RepID=A0A6H1ZBG2_9ZZZZ|nr:hypothetical protein [Alphaproteobacteria bacterium]
MAKQLPPASFISAEPTIVSSSIDQRSATGSNRQKGLRKGSHYSYEFALAPLDHADALRWLDLRNEADTVIVEIPQMGLEVGSPGSPTVDGDGQAGASLDVKDLTPNYAILKGQAFNHIGSDDTIRIYVADADVIADGSGNATIPLETMLNWPPEDGDVLVFAEVRIEGFASVERGSFLQDGEGWHHIRFTVEEPG